MGVDQGGSTSGQSALRTGAMALVTIALLGIVWYVAASLLDSYLGPSRAAYAAVAAAGGVVLVSVVAGRSRGVTGRARIALYLAAMAAATGVFLWLVWALTFVLVGLSVGVGPGLAAAGAVTLAVAAVCGLALAGVVLDGDAATNWALNLRMAAAMLMLGCCTLVFFAAVWALVFVLVLFVLPAVAAMYVAGAVTLVGFGAVVYVETRQAAALADRADATAATPERYPELHDRVTRIAAQLNVPVPTIAVAERAAPEAMVVGYRPSNTRLVLSTGTIDALDGAELDAVIAHELAHVANRDAMVMTAVSTPVVVADGIRARLLGGLPSTVESTHGLSDEELWGEDEQWRLDDPGPIESRTEHAGVVGWVVAVVATWTAIVLVDEDGSSDGLPVRLLVAGLVVVILLAWLCSRVIVAVFSRARESVADRTAARVTGSPAALASALRSLDDRIEATPTADLRQAASVSAVSILPLDRGVLADTHSTVPDAPGFVRRLKQRLFGTHPPTERRIATLEAFEAEQESE